ncbi:TOMM precursor leader peptide-binding protein [Haloferacaceae archaeon DSL9]
MSDTPVDPVSELRSTCARPRFNPAFVPVRVDANTLHVRAGPWSGPVVTIRDADGDGVLSRLLDVLDGETSAERILDTFDDEHRPEVARVMLRLVEQDVLVDGETAADAPTRSQLAINYRFRQLDQRRLAEQSVFVVAADEMGRHLVADLLSMGVGHVTVTRRHGDWRPLDDESDDADRLTVREDPDLDARAAEADLLIATADRPRPIVSTLNEIAVETATPFLPVQIHGFDGLVGPAVYTGETACYECFRWRQRASVPGSEGFDAYRSEAGADPSLTTATLPAASRIVAGYGALEALYLLAFGTGYSAGRVLTLDTLSLSFEGNSVLKRPRCPCCGIDATIDTQRYLSTDDLVDAAALNAAERGDD